MAKLYLAASQTHDVANPYVFPMTGIRVFSLEEALYHCLIHWRQSVDVLCEPFIRWIEGELGLAKIGARLREICRIDGFAARYLALLAVVDYLPKEAMTALKSDLMLWEQRQTWERLAEQGDHFAARGDNEKAYGLYARALNYQADDVKLLNNAGVALMRIGNFDGAAAHFAKASARDVKNAQLRYNLIEAQICAGDVEAAQNLIEEGIGEDGGKALLRYFQGEIHFVGRNYFEAIKFYEAALAVEYNAAYVYRLCDCFMRVRLFEKAIDTVQTVREKDLQFLRKQAEYFAGAHNIPSAIKSIEKALVTHGDSGELWLILAQYHRQDYDLPRASGAISRALTLMPDNSAALLEQARIRKAQGRTKEYHSILNKILTGFKRNYRELREN